MSDDVLLDIPGDQGASFAKRFAIVLTILEVKQAELADFAEVTDRAIRGWLNGVIPFRPNLLSIFGFTGFSSAFLLAGHPAATVTGLNFWARVKAPKYVKARFAAFISIVGEFVQQILLEGSLPESRVAEVHWKTLGAAPNEAARAVREHFELGDRPIDSLRLAEKLGVLVVYGPSEGLRVDAYSAWVDGRPVIVLNRALVDEFRLWHTVAHELGHLFLHDPSTDMTEETRYLREDEAEDFARELMVPTSAQTNQLIARAVRTRGLDALTRIRNIYRTSMSDILTAAKRRNLEASGFIDGRAVEFNASGVSGDRTAATPRFDGPTLLPDAVEAICVSRQISLVGLAEEVGIPARFLNLMVSRNRADALDADRVVPTSPEGGRDEPDPYPD